VEKNESTRARLAVARMPPKLSPALAVPQMPHPEELIAGDLKVGKYGITFIRASEETSPPRVTPTLLNSQLDKICALSNGHYNTVSHYVLKEDRSVSCAVKKIPNASTACRKSIVDALWNVIVEHNNHTVTLLNAFYRSHTLYLAMEYMDCGSLETLCSASQTRLSEPVSAYIAGQILRSLRFIYQWDAHAGDGKKGIRLHRGVEPSRVMLASDGTVKLSYFSAPPDSPMFSYFGNSYMSPERIRGRPYSRLSDIWSVGVLVAEMLTGAYPFSPFFLGQINEIVVFQQFAFTNFPVSVQCEDFVARSMAASEETRWTANELLDHPWLTSNETEGREEFLTLLRTTKGRQVSPAL
jgi:serine/threonine protein kinase